MSTEESISKIQQIINDRAKEKLNTDIRAINGYLTSGTPYNLLKEISINIGTAEKPQTTSLSYILNTTEMWSRVFDASIQKYIDRESKEFVQQVESLRSDVDSLLEGSDF